MPFLVENVDDIETLEAVECHKWGRMGHSTRSMENISAGGMWSMDAQNFH